MKKFYAAITALGITGVIIAQCTVTLPANTYTVFSGPSYLCTTSTPANIQICANGVGGDSTGGAGKKYYVENGGYMEVKPGIGSYTAIVKSGGTFNALGGSNGTVYYEMGSIIQNFNGPPLPPCPGITFNYSLLGGNPCLQTGIEEEDGSSFKVFPNPSNGIVSVECLPGCELRVSDVTGRVILETKTETDVVSIDLRAFGSGVYFLALTTVTATAFQRVIVN